MSESPTPTSSFQAPHNQFVSSSSNRGLVFVDRQHDLFAEVPSKFYVCLLHTFVWFIAATSHLVNNLEESPALQRLLVYTFVYQPNVPFGATSQLSHRDV